MRDDARAIATCEGGRAFKVNGKALRIRSTFILESPTGEELLKIQEKKLRIRDTMEVERDGHTVAKIKKALITRCGTATRSSSPMAVS